MPLLMEFRGLSSLASQFLVCALCAGDSSAPALWLLVLAILSVVIYRQVSVPLARVVPKTVCVVANLPSSQCRSRNSLNGPSPLQGPGTDHPPAGQASFLACPVPLCLWITISNSRGTAEEAMPHLQALRSETQHSVPGDRASCSPLSLTLLPYSLLSDNSVPLPGSPTRAGAPAAGRAFQRSWAATPWPSPPRPSLRPGRRPRGCWRRWKRGPCTYKEMSSSHISGGVLAGTPPSPCPSTLATGSSHSALVRYTTCKRRCPSCTFQGDSGWYAAGPVCPSALAPRSTHSALLRFTTRAQKAKSILLAAPPTALPRPPLLLLVAPIPLSCVTPHTRTHIARGKWLVHVGPPTHSQERFVGSRAFYRASGQALVAVGASTSSHRCTPNISSWVLCLSSPLLPSPLLPSPPLPSLPLPLPPLPWARMQQVEKQFCSAHMPRKMDAREAWEVHAAKVAQGALAGKLGEDMAEGEGQGGGKRGKKGRRAGRARRVRRKNQKR